MPTVTINELKHYYEDQGQGEALVMLHGATSSAHAFEEHFPELTQKYRVIAPDMRSMGRSAHVPEMPPSAWVDDLLALLDHLQIPKNHIYGTSLGSRVAMRFAIEYPDRVLSLVLGNPIIAITPEATANLNRAGGDWQNIPEPQQENYALRHGDDWKDVVLNYFNIRNKPELQEYFGLRDLVSQIKAPMLILRGDSLEDTTHPYAHPFELHTLVPHSRLAILPTYSGGSVWGINPTRLRHEIMAFLESLVPVPAS